MDAVTLVFYAVVCGCLAAYSVRVGGLFARLAFGAIVGVVAAAVLPLARTALGM